MEDTGLVRSFFELTVKEWGFNTAEKAQFKISSFLGNISLQDKSLLDIGCGTGLMSIYAACKGATAVICLEPEADGSTGGSLALLRKVVDILGLSAITAYNQTLDEFDPQGRKFDIVLMDSSINHLDEEACIDLQHSQQAREKYREIFKSISALMKSGGTLIVRDCSRYNFLAGLGIKNPLNRDIEWHKHQSPKFWAELMGQCDFINPEIQWPLISPKLRFFKKIVCSKVGAYFLRSSFRLTMQRA